MTDQTLAKLAEAVQRLDQRLQSLEAKQADIQRKAEVVQAAAKAWRPLMRVQSDVLISNDLGETCRVPLTVLRPLIAGRPLDLDLREGEDDMVELRDPHGRLVVVLPRLALLALPKIAASAELTKLMTGSLTATSGVASRSCTPATVATRITQPRALAELRATGRGPREGSPSTAPVVKDDQEG